MLDSNEIKRCSWCGNDPIYMKYHDEEWGKPVHDDRIHFEFIILEGAQAGLSWITILKRREGYRKAFSDYDPEKVAAYTSKDVEKLMEDTGIIRNRRKIESAIQNAKVFLEIQNDFGSFDAYIWRFTEGKVVAGDYTVETDIPAKTALSEKVSNDLKKRGMKFVGPVIMYSFLQATGIVNDHIKSCAFR